MKNYNGNIYVTNSINGTISIIDGLLNTIIDTIDIFDNDYNLNGITFNFNNETFMWLTIGREYFYPMLYIAIELT